MGLAVTVPHYYFQRFKMKCYIRSATCISPQKTFGDVGFLTDVVEYDQNRLRAIEPDYKAFVDPKLIRRMSRMVKMGVAAARQCLTDAGIDMPGAIITGTALGCQEDTVQFLTRMIEQQEELLPPTAFIQSTHNTVAAQIALMLRCHNYNSTFVHKGVSFENALLDALMLLMEEDADNILVGGTEETTDASFTILTRLGLFKRWPMSNLSLINSHTKGAVCGEGSIFFLLSNTAGSETDVVLEGLTTYYKPANLEQKITGFLTEHGLTINDIDLVITGKNGDLKNDAVYETLQSGIFKVKAVANYKHLCGEYSTANAFALWAACRALKTGTVPAILMEDGEEKNNVKKILIYNHYFNDYHSLMLVSGG